MTHRKAENSFATTEAAESVRACVREYSLREILDVIATEYRAMAEENGHDESDMADDARIVFHAAAHVKG